MATQASTRFTSWTLSEEEYIQASQLTKLQRCLLQNLAAQTAETILALQYDPTNPVQFAQDDATLKGQLAAYTYLLDIDDVNKPPQEAIVM